MMPSPQKAKGSNWERTIADFLTKTYSEKFTRAPGSGAYVGGTNTVRRHQLHENTVRVFKGDIIPGESFPLLNVECKSYKSFPFHQLLSGAPVRQLEQWIDQCVTASDAGDLNILFLKFNNQGTYVCTPSCPVYHLPLHSTTYQSEKYGVWLFCELQSFFKLNRDHLKLLSQKILYKAD